jgi:hypothetical protein
MINQLVSPENRYWGKKTSLETHWNFERASKQAEECFGHMKKKKKKKKKNCSGELFEGTACVGIMPT